MDPLTGVPALAMIVAMTVGGYFKYTGSVYFCLPLPLGASPFVVYVTGLKGNTSGYIIIFVYYFFPHKNVHGYTHNISYTIKKTLSTKELSRQKND